MAQQFPSISEKLRQFIKAQKIFFVATVTAYSRSSPDNKPTHIIEKSS